MTDPRPDRPDHPEPNVVLRATAALFVLITLFIVIFLIVD